MLEGPWIHGLEGSWIDKECLHLHALQQLRQQGNLGHPQLEKLVVQENHPKKKKKQLTSKKDHHAQKHNDAQIQFGMGFYTCRHKQT